MEPDLVVSALLSELKAENAHKSRLIQGLVKVICGCILALLVTVGGFLWYLNQYEVLDTSMTTNTATGVYALIDSEGNVVAQDLTPENIKHLMEVLNGTSHEDCNSSTVSEETQW